MTTTFATNNDDVDSLTTEVPQQQQQQQQPFASCRQGCRHCDDDDEDGDCFVRPILVGYAFGPKKMNTMTVVMAEASKSMMMTEEEVEVDDDNGDDENDMEEENKGVLRVNDDDEVDGQRAGRDEECSDSLSDNGSSPTTTQQHATEVAQQQHQLNLFGSFGSSYGCLGFSQAVGYFRTSCSSSVAASETAGSTTTTYGTTITATPTTTSSLGRLTATTTKRSIRVSFVPLDLDIPLEEQHGGNMDIILHKLTEDILWVSQCSKQRLEVAGSSESSEQEQRIQRLIQYQRDHPNCSLVDDPTRIQVVMNRADIAVLLQNHLVAVTSTSGWAVRSPRYLVVHQQDLSTAATGPSRTSRIPHDDDNSLLNDWKRRLNEARVRYPIIVKPLTAAGTKTSHSMAILLQPSGLRQFLNKVQHRHNSSTAADSSSTTSSVGGYLWQEYVNHNAVLYKVYVLGPHVRVYPRPSLPNLPYGDDLLHSHPKQTMVEFDSQRPYPQWSDFFEDSRSSASSPLLPPPPPLNLSVDEVQPIVQALKRAFGLELFGFDILVTTNPVADNNTNQQPELWVVDVNYFPSYKEVSNFSNLLAQYLTQRAIQGRRRRQQRRQSSQQNQEQQQQQEFQLQQETHMEGMTTT